MSFSEELEKSKTIINEAMAEAFVRASLNTLDNHDRANHSVQVAEYVAIYIEKVLRAVEVTHLIRAQLRDLKDQRETLASESKGDRGEDDGPPQ